LIALRWYAVVLVLLAGTADAGEPAGVEILQYGVFRSEIVGKQRDVGGITHNVVDKICHIATTRVVPMQIGVQFGLRYRVTGPIEGQRVLLRKVVRYPAVMTPPPPEPARSQVMNFVELPVGTTSYTEYAFEQAWELVAGSWTFQFFERDRKLAEFSFTVTEDASLPETGESTCFQLSS
jgi:Domain of unknown function (DUF3859)